MALPLQRAIDSLKARATRSGIRAVNPHMVMQKLFIQLRWLQDSEMTSA